MTENSTLSPSQGGKWLRRVVAAAVLLAVGVSGPVWWPRVIRVVDTLVAGAKPRNTAGGEGHAAAGHSDKDSGHAHGSPSDLELSAAAMRNLGLTDEAVRPVELQSYQRSIMVPAVVVPRPGRTHVQVAAPLTGVITHVHAVAGEAVAPGTLLFEIRLTHEELVVAQTQYLQSLGELEVENREIARLEDVAGGAVAGRSLLDRRYAKEKLEALIRSQREALRLHGLSDRQVDEIGSERRLLRELRVVAPETDTHDHEAELQLSGGTATPVAWHDEITAAAPVPLIIEQLSVVKGQAVEAGDTLCSLADLSLLAIEGQAFDQDAPAIIRAAENDWSVTAVIPTSGEDRILKDLKLAWIGSEIDPDSRTLSFFVDLPNQILRDVSNPELQRFVTWSYRPGQRLQLLIPVEEWQNQIVLPVDAVVRDGAEWYVFRKTAAGFQRLSVHVRHRDQTSAVIANDGTINPGNLIARRSAHQMQMALKNKSGTGADPHAGHQH